MKQWASLLAGLALAGCASQSKDVPASYVSPVQYGYWSCRALSMEVYRISNRLPYLAGVQDVRARGDAIKAGVAAAGAGAAVAGGLASAGLLGASSTTASNVTLLAGSGVAIGSGVLIQGNDEQTTELARLKGELDAVERAYSLKECGLSPYGGRGYVSARG
jgi:hypothetical protein